MKDSFKYLIAKQFYNEVCKLAEENILKTGKVEGSHYAAMKTVLEKYRNDKEESSNFLNLDIFGNKLI